MGRNKNTKGQPDALEARKQARMAEKANLPELKLARMNELAEEYGNANQCPQVLYHWIKNGVKAISLLSAGVVKESVFREHFSQSQSSDARVGPGMYLSENRRDSAGWGNYEGAALIRVALPLNFPWLNLYDEGLKAKFRRVNPPVAQQDICSLDLRPELLVRYDSTWYCLKIAAGCTFGVVNGQGVNLDNLKSDYATIKRTFPLAADALWKQLLPNIQSQMTK